MERQWLTMKTMIDNERQWLKMVELRRGTFLVLEVIQEYENSGNYTRVQGKYLPVIRRHIFEDYGFLSEDNDDYRLIMRGLSKTMERL